MTKYVFVIGGVISGVGKGVATASIGRILKERGYNVTAVKIDPYINVDAGTLRPTEHGEVWVTKDGGEIDQDLGNYERFLDISIPKKNNITTGQVYKSIIDKERQGDYLGKTVQFIPHVPEEIKNRIKEASEDNDIVMVEIGGVVGDYENFPFLFTAKKLENELGSENVSYALVTYLLMPSHIDEMKTKPAQTSINLLRESGIQPDFILCRGRDSLDEVRKKKLEASSNISSESIISMPDAASSKEEAPKTLYSIPLELEKEDLGRKVLNSLNLESKREPSWDSWNEKSRKLVNPSSSVEIALIGKYLDVGDYELKDSYVSVEEALKHAGANNDVKVNINWIDAKEVEKGEVELSKFDGFIVPGGFGTSGIEGKIEAISHARENNKSYLGLCLGLQLAVVEYARNVAGLKAHTTEFKPEIEHNVVDILPEQKNVSEKGGTMRLGSYKAVLEDDSRLKDVYGKKEVEERHRHRYEVNPEYHDTLENNGLRVSGKSPEGRLAEFIELPRHNFFVATQAHPEFNSSLMNPSPLFSEFVRACKS